MRLCLKTSPRLQTQFKVNHVKIIASPHRRVLPPDTSEQEKQILLLTPLLNENKSCLTGSSRSFNSSARISQSERRPRSTRCVYVTPEGQPKGAPPHLGDRSATANHRADSISTSGPERTAKREISRQRACVLTGSHSSAWMESAGAT